MLPKATDTRIRLYKNVKTKDKSSWPCLQRVYELKLYRFIAMAIRKPSCEFVIVKNFVESDSNTKVKRSQQTQYQKYLVFLEAFHSEGSVYDITTSPSSWRILLRLLPILLSFN